MYNIWKAIKPFSLSPFSDFDRVSAEEAKSECVSQADDGPGDDDHATAVCCLQTSESCREVM